MTSNGGASGGNATALRALGDDEALVALRFGRRVVVWPVNACDACDGEGCSACGDEGRVIRGGNRRYWVDGPGAPPDLLRAGEAAAAVDVIIGTTNTATETGRAAWGLDMPNRGDGPAAPTVRLGWLLLTPAAAGVAGSRVLLGVHYPSDVTAGALVGTLMGLGAGYLRRRKEGEATESTPTPTSCP